MEDVHGRSLTASYLLQRPANSRPSGNAAMPINLRLDGSGTLSGGTNRAVGVTLAGPVVRNRLNVPNRGIVGWRNWQCFAGRVATTFDEVLIEAIGIVLLIFGA